MNDTVEVFARPAPRKAVAATRRWLFRLASVFCGLSLFGAFELFCAAADCPLRITTPLETALQEAAETNHVPLINAHELLRSRCPHAIIGKNVLVDHVHPSFRGHEDIAVAIADWMLAAGLLTSTNVDWKLAAQRECRTQLQSLDDLYFLRGRRALESLKLWAAGRSGGPPLMQLP